MEQLAAGHVLIAAEVLSTHVGTSHRDMGPTAVAISAPFPVEILWADLEVAPRV